MPEECGDEVGHALDRRGAGRLGRLAVAGEVERDHLSALPQPHHQIGEDTAAHADAMHQHVGDRPLALLLDDQGGPVVRERIRRGVAGVSVGQLGGHHGTDAIRRV